MKILLLTATVITILLSNAMASIDASQEVVDAILNNKEIQSVVSDIAVNRAIECRSPGSKEIRIIEIPNGSKIFEAQFYCNAPIDPDTGSGGANYQIITVSGGYTNLQDSVVIRMSGLKIEEYE